MAAAAAGEPVGASGQTVSRWARLRAALRPWPALPGPRLGGGVRAWASSAPCRAGATRPTTPTERPSSEGSRGALPLRRLVGMGGRGALRRAGAPRRLVQLVQAQGLPGGRPHGLRHDRRQEGEAGPVGLSPVQEKVRILLLSARPRRAPTRSGRMPLVAGDLNKPLQSYRYKTSITSILTLITYREARNHLRRRAWCTWLRRRRAASHLRLGRTGTRASWARQSRNKAPE